MQLPDGEVTTTVQPDGMVESVFWPDDTTIPEKVLDRSFIGHPATFSKADVKRIQEVHVHDSGIAA